MTAAVLVAAGPSPGEVWTGASAKWRCLDSGLLVRLGDDNPGAGVTVEEAAAVDGPLRPPPARLRLAAALRRAACEESCAPTCPCRDESAQRVDDLLARAEVLERVVA